MLLFLITLSLLLQTMEVGDFTSTVACFMRLSWAAAAGRLDLVGSSQPIKESNSLFPAGIRNRLSSSGTDSEGWDHEVIGQELSCQS